MRPRFVVVGGGLAGARAVQALRENGCDGSITLIGDGPHEPYDRPPLSKAYLHGTADRASLPIHSQAWYVDNEIDLRVGVRVTSLDREARRIELSGSESLPYDKLLLATGSAPRWLRVPGAHLAGVHYLRRVEDSDSIAAAFARSPRVVIIGGGWIGLETAAAARGRGLDVTVLEQAELPLLGVLGHQLATVFADLHRDNGVRLRCEVQVQGIVGADGSTTGVRLASGETIPADLVLVGVGITPNTDLAEPAGLLVANGIVVDEQLRTADPDVFAAGDVANAYHPFLRRHLRVEHWANARHQPAVAAASMMGQAAAYDRLPYFYTDQYDLGMEYTGHVEPGGSDRIVIRGDLGRREFIAFWLRGEQILAGMNVNVWDVTESIAALIRNREPVAPERLADPDVPLASLTRTGGCAAPP